MTIEELNSKIEGLILEAREFNTSMTANQLSLASRIDNLDLNGTAKHLREFGEFLKEHPGFMKREVMQESKRQEKEIALDWLAGIFHLREFKKKSKWALGAFVTGVLLSLGNTINNVLGSALGTLHSFGHVIFK